MTNLTNKLAEDETVIEITGNSSRGLYDTLCNSPHAEANVIRMIIHTYEANKAKHKEEKYKLAREEFWKSPPLWPIEKTLGMKQSDYEKIMMQGEWPRDEFDYVSKAQYRASVMAGRRMGKTDDMVDAFRYAMYDMKPPKPFTFWQKIKRLFKR